MIELNDQERADMLDNCRKATFLIEKQQAEGITPKEESELAYHLNICEMCRVFEKQSTVINLYVKNLSGGGKNELKLDDGFKEKLQKQIDTKYNQTFRKD